MTGCAGPIQIYYTALVFVARGYIRIKSKKKKERKKTKKNLHDYVCLLWLYKMEGVLSFRF